MPPASPTRARFGDFELNLKTRELRNDEKAVYLQEQPYRVLRLLLERGHEVVTREEIRNELWATDTVVDFERSINTVIATLRRTLGDSRETPKYIETLPRLGYRFLVSAEWIQPAVGAGPERAEEGPDKEQTSHAILRTPERGTALRFSAAKWLAIAVLLVAIGTLVGLTYFHPSSRLADKDVVVLADFANGTGDPVFDDTLRTALSIALNESPFLNVLPENRVGATLELMTRPATTVLTATVAEEVCQRVGGKAYITGSIVPLGTSYVLTLKAVNCQDSGLLGQEQVTATSKEEVLNSLGRAATKMRAQLGESLGTLKQFDIPLAQATTPSLEALKEYNLGHKSGESITALSHYKRAIELDPDFAMAYLAIGWYYFGLTEIGEAQPYFTRAFELREHASRRENLKITADYYINVTGELDRATRAYGELAANYPRDPEAYVMNIAYSAQGQYEKALQIYRNPLDNGFIGSFDPYDNIALTLMALQRFDEASQSIRTAEQHGMDDSLVHTERYALAFLAGDSNAMAEQQQWYSRNPEYETFGLALASDTELYQGHVRQAEDLSKKAEDAALRSDAKETAAIWRQNTAVGLAAMGDGKEAKQLAAAGLKLAPTGPGVEAEAALALALSGDTAKADSLARQLDQRFGKDTQMQALWLPAIRAQIALNRRNAATAIGDLRDTSPPLELGQIMFLNNISCLYHTYVRGQAYLAANQGTEAAAEFQKIIDHSGIVWNCWTGALARLGLARANALQARTETGTVAVATRARALAGYKDFLTLWQDADPDLPVFKEAKAEYAELQRLN